MTTIEKLERLRRARDLLQEAVHDIYGALDAIPTSEPALAGQIKTVADVAQNVHDDIDNTLADLRAGKRK